jgi:hypothetical protein
MKVALYPNNSGNPNIGTLLVSGGGTIFTIPEASGYISGKITVIQSGVTKAQGEGYTEYGLVTAGRYSAAQFITTPDPTDTIMFIYLLMIFSN